MLRLRWVSGIRTDLADQGRDPGSIPVRTATEVVCRGPMASRDVSATMPQIVGAVMPPQSSLQDQQGEQAGPKLLQNGSPSSWVEMAGAFDNIHPGLTHEEALRLLALPVDQLESQSDPYMAAAHLINFPCPETEQALITLVLDGDQSQPRRLARRKAVEVLGRLDCQDSIPAIGRCLSSDDRYLVENAAFALQLLRCQDSKILADLSHLLIKSEQNQRVLIQALAALNVSGSLKKIEALLKSEDHGVRGAAISAMASLGGQRQHLPGLADQMLLSNQMDRQSAIQDAINAHAVELLPKILRAPVSPVFRMRALKALWPLGCSECEGLKLIAAVDGILLDCAESLELVHEYDQAPSDDFLVQEFFGTDFSRSYLALGYLQKRSPDLLWPLLEKRWNEEAHNDYGAHYFFIRLFGLISQWPDSALPRIEEILLEAIATQRPQFMKSKPAAILSMASLGLITDASAWGAWLDPQSTPFWESRYAAAMVAPREFLDVAREDPNPFVAARADFAES